MKDIDRYPCLDPNFIGNFQCFPKTSAVILTGSPYCFGVLKFNVKFILCFFSVFVEMIPSFVHLLISCICFQPLCIFRMKSI